jgi:hypothetical protein
VEKVRDKEVKRFGRVAFFGEMDEVSKGVWRKEKVPGHTNL